MRNIREGEEVTYKTSYRLEHKIHEEKYTVGEYHEYYLEFRNIVTNEKVREQVQKELFGKCKIGDIYTILTIEKCYKEGKC